MQHLLRMQMDIGKIASGIHDVPLSGEEKTEIENMIRRLKTILEFCGKLRDLIDVKKWVARDEDQWIELNKE